MSFGPCALAMHNHAQCCLVAHKNGNGRVWKTRAARCQYSAVDRQRLKQVRSEVKHAKREALKQEPFQVGVMKLHGDALPSALFGPAVKTLPYTAQVSERFGIVRHGASAFVMKRKVLTNRRSSLAVTPGLPFLLSTRTHDSILYGYR